MLVVPCSLARGARRDRAGTGQPETRTSPLSTSVRQRLNVDPWFGIGADYEWTSIFLSFTKEKIESGLHGFELANVQAGVDFRIGNFSLGPFVTLSFAEYMTASGSDINDGELTDLFSSKSIPNKGIHEWLFVGVSSHYSIELSSR
jgi:hypothetical protein